MRSHVKFALAASVMAAAVGYVAYLGASTSYQYYLVVDECAASAGQLENKRLRVSGRVAADSLKIADDRRAAEFILEGEKHRLAVHCTGVVPDNLTEGMDVVVEGSLRGDGCLEGDAVITRCASKYDPQGS